jgi:hypothetical protein
MASRLGKHLSPAHKAAISRGLRKHYASSGRTTLIGADRYGIRSNQANVTIVPAHWSTNKGGRLSVRAPTRLSGKRLDNAKESKKSGVITIGTPSGQTVRISPTTRVIRSPNEIAHTIHGTYQGVRVGKGYNFKARKR